MKIKFIKILPIAVAVLFATSCSKDDVDNTVKTPQEIVQENVDNTINDNVETPQEIVQENDDNTVKTITITGKVSKESLSKVSLVVEEGITTKKLKFDGGEKFEFDYKTSNQVWGKITIDDQDGNYTAQLYFKGEGDNLVGPEFTASKGSNSESISEAYDNLNLAVQNAYYTIKFKVSRVPNAAPATGYTYKLYTDGKTDIVVDIQSAFINALSDKTTKLGGTDISVAADKYYVVPVGKAMGNSSNNTLAGRIYSIGSAVPKDCLPGVFSVSSNKKVYFSKGNLQATTTDFGENWTWGFATNQYDYIGNATANTAINGNGTVSTNGTVDLFGWVGASSTWTGAAQYGISNDETFECTTSNYGNGMPESIKSDWGNVFGTGSGWFTLDFMEWQYLLNSGDYTNDIRAGKYGIGTIHSTLGLIILPDGYETPSGITTAFVSGTTNTTYSDEDWNKMESAGAVFLPAAGNRLGSTVSNDGSNAHYWSSSGDLDKYAWNASFSSTGVDARAGYTQRRSGGSVRLVRVAE